MLRAKLALYKKEKSATLLAMGNPLLDIQVRNGEKLLEKYNLKPNDAILADEKQKEIYSEVLSLSPVYLAGGAAQNAARFAQYILPEKSTVYLGAVGADKLADQLREANKKEGLNQLYQIISDSPTGACAVVITGHNRSLCTQLGAAEKFSPSHLKEPEVTEAIEDAKVFYLGGFFLTHGIESALELAKAAAKDEKIFTMNLSAPFISQFFKENVDKVLPFVDYLFGNESEALAYAEAHSWDTKHLPTIAAKIASQPKQITSRSRIVIITQGAESTIVASTSTSAFPPSAKLDKVEDGHVLIVPVKPLKSEEIVDTNGAGDAFAGGVLGGIVLGKPLDESIEIGHKLGQMCVGQEGPQLKWPKVQIV
ncbi:Ribokinase-like protein [Phakopsora pachyrhizi]|uniref:Adenosine kinase n=1 Tax=Phakopsora pachyrhizi TaxID=170000 RepID=A0AAV0B3A9_PHAPC|nr:Ribokinase-like protein [Phakopsora pachyrhizi]